jgi:alkyl hydroperoxide reductase subunit AhpC
VVQYAVYHNTDIGRSVSETLRILEALSTGERCPVEWKRGDKTLGK